MSTRVTIAGHPIHAMLVTIPIGLWVFTLVSDVAYASTGDPRWDATAYFTLGGGIVGALIAAVPGFIDLLGLHDVHERRIGVIHMGLNLSIVILQLINFWLRTTVVTGPSVWLALSAVAVAGLLMSGWLGGQLVHVLGVTQPHHRGESRAPGSDRLHPQI